MGILVIKGGSDQGLISRFLMMEYLLSLVRKDMGKNVTGARAGEGREIYHVTNLNDAGPGSFS